jgi:hypothetical protein
MGQLFRFQRISILLACLIAVLASGVASAYAQDIPPIVVEGLEIYSLHGIEPALKVWAKDGPLEGSESLAGLAYKLADAEKFLVDYESYELVEVRSFNPVSKAVFLTLNYNKGPLFVKFLTYRPKGGAWVITAIEFDLDPEKVLFDLRS